MKYTQHRGPIAAGLLALAVLAGPAQAKELSAIGITVGSLGNPFFTAIAHGATAEAQKINPQVKVITVSSDYDLNKQFTQIDNFIAAGVDMILLNAADPKAIAPAVRKAQAAGIVVVAIDVSAQGADATVTTDNVKAGAISCQVIADRLHGKGEVVIVNGPQVSAVVDRVQGCEGVLAKTGLKVLSDNQNAQGSRDGGFAVMQGLLTRFPHVDAVFAINDPTAIGASLAAKQLHRSEFFITSVDGAPDIEPALKDPSTLIVESAAQDPYVMAQKSVDIGNDILGGKKPASPVELLSPAPVTADTLPSYKGWSAPR